MTLDPARFVAEAARHGRDFYASVPCSYLTPLFDHVAASGAAPFVTAANEGDAVAIACGAWLGGRGPVVMFQNSGLGNAVNPLTSLAQTCAIPLLLVVTLRGDPDGPADEPQHALMGRITTDLLELMQYPWQYLPGIEAEADRVLAEAGAGLANGLGQALVVRKGVVAKSGLPAPRSQPPPRAPKPAALPAAPVTTRAEFLAAVQQAAGPRDVLLATTGYAGRELYALDDRANQFYMVGSMGCVASLALGLALARPDLRVLALDGDGALLMRLGVLSTIGQLAPPNLVHLLLDNGIHESTGGQPTASPWVDFPALAAGCGYAEATRLGDPAALRAWLAAPASGPRFAHLPVHPGALPDLPRPSVTPEQVAPRLRAHVAGIPAP
ncbi:MAG TPA: phosphonopyruvate decarboxylase [Gammaproteobacteria bacterium]